MPNFSQLVVDAYNARPVIDATRIAFSYHKLIEYTVNKFNDLQQTLKKIEFVPVDEPYESFIEMNSKVLDSLTLFVSSNNCEHPIFTPKQNMMFRAVHDYYGHIVGGFDFSVNGEFETYKYQALDTPHAALPALFAEIVGQTSYFDVYGKFPNPQKACYLFGFNFRNLASFDVKDYQRNFYEGV